MDDYPQIRHHGAAEGVTGSCHRLQLVADRALLPAPKAPHGCDVLVLESTYDDRLHEQRRTRRSRLKAAIERALENAGTVIIPAFSIGRTQELLYELEGLSHAAKDSRWRELEIIVDSPLAARFTQLYRELKPYWDAEAHRLLGAVDSSPIREALCAGPQERCQGCPRDH